MGFGRITKIYLLSLYSAIGARSRHRPLVANETPELGSHDLRSAVTRRMEHGWCLRGSVPRPCATGAPTFILVSFDGQLRALVTTIAQVAGSPRALVRRPWPWPAHSHWRRSAGFRGHPHLVPVLWSPRRWIISAPAFGVSRPSVSSSPRSAPRSPTCWLAKLDEALAKTRVSAAKMCSRSATTPWRSCCALDKGRDGSPRPRLAQIRDPLTFLTSAFRQRAHGARDISTCSPQTFSANSGSACTQSQVCGQVGSLWPSLPHSCSPEHLLPLRSCGVLVCTTSPRHVGRVALPSVKTVAPKRNFLCQMLSSSGCTRASRWKFGNAARGRFAPAGLQPTFLPCWTWIPSPV